MNKPIHEVNKRRADGGVPTCYLPAGELNEAGRVPGPSGRTRNRMSLPPDEPSYGVPDGGHHVAWDRNVVGPTRGTAGTDIFFAAVQMTRMPMCLSDPHLEDQPIVFCNGPSSS